MAGAWGKIRFYAWGDTGLVQRGEINIRILLGEVALEGNVLPLEQRLDRGDIAFEQFGDFLLGMFDIDTRKQSPVKYDLETVFAHAGLPCRLYREGFRRAIV